MKTPRATLYAILNEDNSVSLLDASFQRVASWAEWVAGKPKKGHSQVMYNCWKHAIVWAN